MELASETLIERCDFGISGDGVSTACTWSGDFWDALFSCCCRGFSTDFFCWEGSGWYSLVNSCSQNKSSSTSFSNCWCHLIISSCTTWSSFSWRSNSWRFCSISHSSRSRCKRASISAFSFSFLLSEASLSAMEFACHLTLVSQQWASRHGFMIDLFNQIVR